MATTTKSSIGAKTFVQRLIGAAACDIGTYEEIEADPGATTQAFVVVVISSLAAGVGALGWNRQAVAIIPLIAVASLLFWAAWALLTFEVGRRLMPAPDTRTDVGELLRTIGFASAPGLVRVLGILPAATTPVFVVTTVWMLAAMVVAVRQSLDYHSTPRALMVCIVGWTLAALIAALFGLIFTPAVG
jgi:hypothetical protein